MKEAFGFEKTIKLLENLGLLNHWVDKVNWQPLLTLFYFIDPARDGSMTWKDTFVILFVVNLAFLSVFLLVEITVSIVRNHGGQQIGDQCARYENLRDSYFFGN